MKIICKRLFILMFFILLFFIITIPSAEKFDNKFLDSSLNLYILTETNDYPITKNIINIENEKYIPLREFSSIDVSEFQNIAPLDIDENSPRLFIQFKEGFIPKFVQAHIINESSSFNINWDYTLNNDKFLNFLLPDYVTLNPDKYFVKLNILWSDNEIDILNSIQYKFIIKS